MRVVHIESSDISDSKAITTVCVRSCTNVLSMSSKHKPHINNSRKGCNISKLLDCRNKSTAISLSICILSQLFKKKLS